MTLPPSATIDAAAIERMASQYALRVLAMVRESHAAESLALLKLHGAALEQAAEKVFALHDELLQFQIEQQQKNTTNVN